MRLNHSSVKIVLECPKLNKILTAIVYKRNLM